jgi:hypothetical protein
MNTQNFNFAKPKLFFKHIGKYAATSTYIHVRIPFNFTTVFNTKQAIAGVFKQLLDKHEQPFKSITKSVTDFSLAITEGSLEDFRDSIEALPHKTEISMPGRPKRFIAIGISIAPMAMSTFNTIRIKQLNDEISTLEEDSNIGKQKTAQKKGRDKVNNKEKKRHKSAKGISVKILEQRKSFIQSAISIFKSTSQRRGKTKDNFNFKFQISNFKSQFQNFIPNLSVPTKALH